MAKTAGKKAGGAKRKTAKTAAKKRVVAKTAKPKAAIRVTPRRLKQPKYKTLRPHKRIKHPTKLTNVWQLTRRTALMLWKHKKLFIGITLVYGVLNLVLVQGLSGGVDVSSLKHSVSQVFKGHLSGLASSLSVFVLLVGSAGSSTTPTGSVYQLFLALMASLALIWTLRQVLAGATGLRIRDAYYNGMYPFVPFILILLLIGVQLVPLIVGSVVYGTIVTNGIAVYAIEKVLWALFYALLALLSLYMITSSLFALYIVTLPDMTPMKALKSARELVRYRRWTVLRKILWLPLVLLIIAAVIMLPVIVWLAPAAKWVFFLLTLSSLPAVHAYMYTLYRELLNE